MLLAAALVLGACTEDQSKHIGAAPKQAIERAERDVNKALEQGAERSREEK